MGRNDNVRLQHIIWNLAEKEVRASRGSGADGDLSAEEIADAMEICARLNDLLKDGKRRTWGRLMQDIRGIVRTALVDFKTQSKLRETCDHLGLIVQPQEKEGCIHENV